MAFPGSGTQNHSLNSCLWLLSASDQPLELKHTDLVCLICCATKIFYRPRIKTKTNKPTCQNLCSLQLYRRKGSWGAIKFEILSTWYKANMSFSLYYFILIWIFAVSKRQWNLVWKCDTKGNSVWHWSVTVKIYLKEIYRKKPRCREINRYFLQCMPSAILSLSVTCLEVWWMCT